MFGGIERPSAIYKEWANAQIRSEEFKQDVLSLETQQQFETLHLNVGNSLGRYWKDKTGQDLILPYKYKLLDVFVKRACELDLPYPKMNDKLLLYGHVPLDSLVFKAIDDMFSDIFLLTGRAMGHVNEHAYHFYQGLIRQLMSELESPALFFEFYAWNIRRDA